MTSGSGPPCADGRRVTAFGETLTVRQWAARAGLSVAAVRWRLRAGWDPAFAVTAPPRAGRRPPSVEPAPPRVP